MDEAKKKLLKMFLVGHRKAIRNSVPRGYRCVCGAKLYSNSEYALAEHQADVVSEWFERNA